MIEANITWMPYQLEPNAPPEGFSTHDYLAKKIGGEQAVKRSHEMLSKLAAEIDLPIALEKATVFPNTLEAHRLVHWAGLIGPEMQDRIARALFEANFVKGENVGDHAVLARIAGECGMDRDVVEHKLGSDADRNVVLGEIRDAQRMGAQSVEVFVNALRQIAGMKRKATS